ncbi:MAG: RSP_7527 family protein [Lautropia sp.]
MTTSTTRSDAFSHVSLSDHERFLAQARMMRAEMVADMIVGAWRAVARLFGAATHSPAPGARDTHAA